jgi:hypothetical protein
MNAAAGSPGSARKAMRRTTSCSVTMPSGRPPGSAITAAEAAARRRRSTSSPAAVASPASSGGGPIASRTRQRKAAVWPPGLTTRTGRARSPPGRAAGRASATSRRGRSARRWRPSRNRAAAARDGSAANRTAAAPPSRPASPPAAGGRGAPARAARRSWRAPAPNPPPDGRVRAQHRFVQREHALRQPGRFVDLAQPALREQRRVGQHAGEALPSAHVQRSLEIGFGEQLLPVQSGLGLTIIRRRLLRQIRRFARQELAERRSGGDRRGPAEAKGPLHPFRAREGLRPPLRRLIRPPRGASWRTVMLMSLWLTRRQPSAGAVQKGAWRACKQIGARG